MDLLTNEKFLIPLLATLGASLSVIGMQFISRYFQEQRQRVYAATYILDVTYRILFSEITLKKHTITPHIKATMRMADEDMELINTALMDDEFDILKAKPVQFSHLPNEYKVLLGYDDIELVQMFDSLLYLYENDINRTDLNRFVSNNLKSAHDFISNTPEKRKDILYTYYDYLNSIDHESNRIIFLVNSRILLSLTKYLCRGKFSLFSTCQAINAAKKIEKLLIDNKDIVPEEEYMVNVINGGIQNEL